MATPQSKSGLLDMNHINFFSVLDHLDDGVIIADMNGFIHFYNQAQSRIDGILPKKAMGLKVTDIYELDNRTSMIMQCALHQRTIKNKIFFYKTISGKVANTITSVYPLFNKNTINGVICFVKDYEQLRRSMPVTAPPECLSGLGNGTRFTFDDLIGTSTDFVRVKETAKKASASPSPIMIQGETGTGKELFAQAIHNFSPRHREKYVAVNCAAIPHDLMEGMLFGTTKGAFTGALDKPGLFETAHKGTLFLDELLAMPVAVQAKLLRAIQEKQVRRLGSVKEIDVDVKIISSVSQDPRVAIQENRLRTDLYYRLGVVMVKLPPLRDRLDSLEELVSHFITKFNLRLGTHIQKISSEVHELFRVYQWPGNIRELEHLIEGAMNMAGQEKTLGIDQFTPGLDALEQNDAAAEPTGNDMKSAPAGAQDFPRPLADIQADQERAAVDKALAASLGNVTRAAETLGISRQLLHYKIKKYRLCRADYMPRPYN
ncbi:MAG: sigma 54-interacting transcriptional regulator [Desulfotignum sp.]|nr:sigma 54-interacting transcriptional regulator [Desulfotignum sp.]